MTDPVRRWLWSWAPLASDRDRLIGLGVTTLATLLMLQAFRVFVPAMIIAFDQSNRLRLAEVTFAVFASVMLGGLLVWLTGSRETFLAATLILVTGRLVIQFQQETSARWLFGAIAVVGWTWLVITLVPRDRDACALGIGFALTLDLLLRTVRGTIDLPWMPDRREHAFTVMLVTVLAMLVLAYQRSPWPARLEAGFRGSAPLLGIGPGLALTLAISGNPGFGEVVTGRDLDGVLWLLGAGTVAAVLMTVSPPDFGARRPAARTMPLWMIIGIGLVAAVAIGAWVLSFAQWVAEIMLTLFSLAVVYLTMFCARGTGPPEREGRWATVTWITAGFLLQAAVTFAYFATSGRLLVLLLLVAVLTAAAGLAAGGIAVGTLSRRAVTLPVAALLAVVFTAWILVDAGNRPPVVGATTGDALVIMTYNVQAGFSRDEVWDLEATAQAIEQQGADVVLLQEVSRGWHALGSMDQVRWLSRRLEMPYVFGAVSHDGMWGNAILTRLPVFSEKAVVFDDTQNLQRGALAVEVETPSGNVLVISTHLDNPQDATSIRMAQVDEVLALWDGRVPAVIGGDFNADPDSEVVQAVLEAGLADTAVSLGPEATTSSSGRRIDYVFVTPDVQVLDVDIPNTWASDHRPVVVSLELPGPE